MRNPISLHHLRRRQPLGCEGNWFFTNNFGCFSCHEFCVLQSRMVINVLSHFILHFTIYENLFLHFGWFLPMDNTLLHRSTYYFEMHIRLKTKVNVLHNKGTRIDTVVCLGHFGPWCKGKKRVLGEPVRTPGAAAHQPHTPFARSWVRISA